MNWMGGSRVSKTKPALKFRRFQRREEADGWCNEISQRSDKEESWKTVTFLNTHFPEVNALSNQLKLQLAVPVPDTGTKANTTKQQKSTPPTYETHSVVNSLQNQAQREHLSSDPGPFKSPSPNQNCINANAWKTI